MARCSACGRFRRDGHCLICHRIANYLNPPAVSFEGALRRERRKALGLTAFDVARAVGVSPDSIWAWEGGRSKPTYDHDQLWETALG